MLAAPAPGPLRAALDDAARAGATAVMVTLVRRPAEAARLPFELADFDPGPAPEQAVLGAPDIDALAAAARAGGVDLVLSVADAEALALARAARVAAVHLPAAVLLDLPLVAAAAADGQPVWLDTAMAELEEVADAVGAAVKEGGRVLLFHGLATARARPDELNLRALVTLRERFGLPVGWQARDAAGAPATAAVALGATVVALPFDPAGTHGFDAAAFAAAAADAALVARALGDGDKRVQPSEWAERDRRHASLVARVDIARGTTLGAGMLATAPPGIGLTPRALAAVVGRQATVDIPAGTLITLGMLD